VEVIGAGSVMAKARAILRMTTNDYPPILPDYLTHSPHVVFNGIGARISWRSRGHLTAHGVRPPMLRSFGHQAGGSSVTNDPAGWFETWILPREDVAITVVECAPG
jgi:hypothetical protein